MFSHQVMFSSLQPPGMQCASPPCPSVSPGVCSNSCPLSQWCHPIISSSVTPFSSCPQSFPVSRECNLLGSVSSQQKSEATDVKALGVPQLSDRYCYSSSLLGRPCYSSWTGQFYLEIKENISSRCEGMLYQKMQREERERGTETESSWEREREWSPAHWLLFLYVFSSPWAGPL